MKGFEGFRDSPETPFYRAGAMSAEATWTEATRRLARIPRSAAAEAQRRPTHPFATAIQSHRCEPDDQRHVALPGRQARKNDA